jgi:branched-chain amino acid transport system permease protein
VSALLNADFWAFVGVIAGIYTILALGLQLQFGFTGLLNFGQVAFMAIAAYTMAILVVRADAPLPLAVVAALAVAALFGLGLALPALRLRADFFAIVTIAFGEVIRYLALNEQGLTGGAQGTIALAGSGQVANYNLEWLRFQRDVQERLEGVIGSAATRDVAMLAIVWLVALVLIVLLQVMVRSPWGRVLRAIREDEDAAGALAKRVPSYKAQSLAIGAALGGVAGVLYAFEFSFFSPNDFDPLTTFFAWTIVILGGTARTWGVPLGALLFGVIFAGTRFFDFPPFSLFGSADRAYLRLIIVGAVLIGLMAFRPQGILGRREELVLE